MPEAGDRPGQQNLAAAFGGGTVIGTLGGLVGPGGTGSRLTLLIRLFRFAALDAVILNKAMGLVVVATALLSGADIKLAGSILSTRFGGRLPGVIAGALLPPALSLILVLSAVKVWRHG